MRELRWTLIHMTVFLMKRGNLDKDIQVECHMNMKTAIFESVFQSNVDQTHKEFQV